MRTGFTLLKMIRDLSITNTLLIILNRYLAQCVKCQEDLARDLPFACANGSNSYKYGYVTKDEYLSGNIRDKPFILGQIKAYQNESKTEEKQKTKEQEILR